MIDIKELRRLAQEATPGPWMIDYVGVGFEVAAGESVIAQSQQVQGDMRHKTRKANAAFIAEANPAAITELLDRLEAWENVFGHLGTPDEVGNEWHALSDRLEAAEKEIAAMKQQEPHSYIYEYVNSIDGSPVWRNVPGFWNGQFPKSSKPLYALPGAQPELNLADPAVQKRLAAQWGYVPATSVSNEWLPVPEKHPTFDPVDLQLSDGSVLCGCVPQSDGDYWWEGPSGEVFIDPKYANVTRWRLAAAPEGSNG